MYVVCDDDGGRVDGGEEEGEEGSVTVWLLLLKYK
jgi:hypothetical protein